MPRDLTELPSDLQAKFFGRNLIVFDGECVLCSGFLRFMYQHDHTAFFEYATAQSAVGQRLYTEMGLPTEDFKTNLVIADAVIYEQLDAFCSAMSHLKAPWRWFSVLRFLPKFLKNPFYDAIATNRYRIFGRYDQCTLPDAKLMKRFVADGI